MSCELEGRVAGDVAVLAARVLEDRLHGLEGGDGFVLVGVGGKGDAGGSDGAGESNNEDKSMCHEILLFGRESSQEFAQSFDAATGARIASIVRGR